MTRVRIIIDIPIHTPKLGEKSDEFEIHYGNDSTVQDLYFYLLSLGYEYPKYQLYQDYDVLAISSRKLVSFLSGNDDILYFNDPVRRRPVATVAVVGAAVSK